MNKCKLCLEEKILLKKSHIIPDFIYKHSGLYDDLHRIRLFTVQGLIDNKKPSLPQSGVYEGNILCADCDNSRLGESLEQYAKKAIFGGGQLPSSECVYCVNFIDEEKNTFAICKNLNYTKFKLFLLSVLWRASISSKSFFKGIKVGEHEEVLRKMIFENDPKAFYDYPVFVYSSVLDENFTPDIIIEPTQVIDDRGVITCYFVIGGFIYIYKVGAFPEGQSSLKNQTITEENKITIYLMQKGETMIFINKYLGI